MTDYRVIIPKETYALLDFRRDGHPATAVVNIALRGFEPKIVFNYQAVLTMKLTHLKANGAPTPEELSLIDTFGDTLDAHIKFDDDHPNALFLGRITWNGRRSLAWRVCDPGLTNHYLMSLITTKDHVREFDFVISPDNDWTLAKGYLDEYPNKP